MRQGHIDDAPSPEELVGLLAEPERLRVFAFLAIEPHPLDALVRATGVSARAAADAVQRLERSSVVTRLEDQSYAVDEGVFKRSARAAAAATVGGLNDEDTRIFRRYFYRGRLLQIPSEEWILGRVLDLVAEDFASERTYTEREVNTTLYAWNGDWATLRRLLVDRGHLTRREGIYRRT